MTATPRPATLADKESMAALEASATAYPWTAPQYGESIVHHHCWVLEEDGRLVGLLVYARVLDEVELLNIAVHRSRHGRGYGKQLLELLFARNRGSTARIFLEVRETNVAAIGLYRGAGFTLKGTRKGYYPAAAGRENALVMSYAYPQTDQR